MSHAYCLAPPTHAPHLPFTGALLVLGGVMLLIAWAVDVAPPGIPSHGARTDRPMAERDESVKTGPGLRLLPSGTIDRAGPAKDASRVAIPLPMAATRTQQERLARQDPIGDPAGQFAPRDLREALAELANIQRGRWIRPCPCPMGAIAR